MIFNLNDSKNFWNYFLSIEGDLKNTSRYVDFSEKNKKTYSIEFARIIMTSTQEIDVIMKEICNISNTDADKNMYNKINHYKTRIEKVAPEFFNEEVFISKYNIRFKPWDEWRNNVSPSWWSANNKIKHERSLNFELATLENAIYSLGALLVTNIYYYKLYHENNEQKSYRLKDITGKIGGSSFIKLDSKYYSKVLVI